MVELSATSRITVANYEQAALGKLFCCKSCISGGGFGIHLSQFVYSPLTASSQLIRSIRKHAGVLDLGNQTGVLGHSGDNRAGSNSELLGVDLQVLFLGNAVELLEA